MNQVTLLRDTLRPHLGWHGARLSFVAAFLMALLRVKTVNFTELATAFGGKAQTDSHYKRLQRFFRHVQSGLCQDCSSGGCLNGNPRAVDSFNRPYPMAVWRLRLQHPDAGHRA